MTAASPYVVAKTLLAERISIPNVSVLYQTPVKQQELFTDTGELETIWFEQVTEGSLDVVVFGGSNLRYDEELTLGVVIQVVGKTSLDTQATTDTRAAELLAEVLSVLSADATLGSNDATPSDAADFDYFIAVPVGQRWSVGPIDGMNGACATRVTVDVQVKARRTVYYN